MKHQFDRRNAQGFLAQAKKQLGQNFLHDDHVIDRILHAIAAKPGDVLVEIGPGQGALTLPLLARHGALAAIEFDRDLLDPLRQAASRQGGQLQLIHSDVLQVDLGALAEQLAGPEGQIRLLGNLPYNLSSPILFHALAHAAHIRDMHFMLQKEVVERMAAAEGSKVYGRLSVMLQAYCHVEALFIVPPSAFKPAPKVDSAVVRLIPRDIAQVQISHHDHFANIVRAAFGQRRKTLHNALRDVVSDEMLEAAGLSPSLRAEQVPVEGFIRLANQASATLAG